ncbi:MAG: hypothetical protein DSZ23_02125 [Thermodesulfatator sp.]|nr:MAG: hypothetical protein DSZ23_02125 [Thermodesulfatator sp.]
MKPASANSYEEKRFPVFLKCLCSAVIVLSFSCFLAAHSIGAEQPIRLGVLAKRGYQKAVKRWSPLAQYLSQRTGLKTVIVPLSFSQVPAYVADNKIDLILANQKFYVTLKKKYGIQALATVINSRGGPFMGGVIFTKKGNFSGSLNDIKGKRLGIVSFGSGGGFLIQAYDLLQKGINVLRDTDIKPLEGQDYVVYAVLNGAVDLGFVRTGQLESMAGEQKITLKDFQVLFPQHHPDFPLLCSTTQLWPAWPLAATGQLSANKAARIKNALLALPAGSRAARTAKIKGFAPPGDYSPVVRALAAIGETN